jgi:YVTN family beta-propeller protein
MLALAGCTKPGFPTYPANYREFAYVANTAGNTVTVLDLVYMRPDRTLSVGVGPVAVVQNPKRDEVYVVNSQPDANAGTVSVIDTSKNGIVATIPVGRNPRSISVDSTGNRAFVANSGSNSVSVIDLTSRKVIQTAGVGERPDMALIAPDGRSLVVSNHGAGSVTIFTASIPAETSSTTTRAKAGSSLNLRATFTGCGGATSPVILPDSSKSFIACSTTHQVMSVGLAVAPDSWFARQDATLMTDHLQALLNVGQNPTNLTLKPDGGEVFASNHDSDSVSEISTSTNEVGSTYSIGNRPAHGVISGDNGALWVSNLGAQAVSLYSIDDGKFLSSIRTGLAPDALAFSADEHLLLAADTRSGDVAIIRTTGKFGPALFTILPVGGGPAAIAVKAMGPRS